MDWQQSRLLTRRLDHLAPTILYKPLSIQKTCGSPLQPRSGREQNIILQMYMPVQVAFEVLQSGK